MSLRARLLVIVLGTLLVTLVATVGAIYGALQDWAQNSDDRVLADAGRQLAARLNSGGELETTGDTRGVWRSMAERGEIPSYFAVFDRDGKLDREVHYGDKPELSEPPGELARSDDGWLIHPVRLDDGRTLVVAMRTATTDELIERTRNIAAICTVVAVTVAALLCVFAVRRQLRPLETIAVTADAIRDGDLSKRIEPVDPRGEVGRVSLALNAMLAALENSFSQRAAAQQRLRQFIADASHELRTPIASIRGYAELFRRGAASRPDDLAMAMTRIESEADRMGGLVDELLQLAELDEDTGLHLAPVDLEVLAADALADAHARAPDREFSLESAGSLVVPGDEARLRQLLANLLSNVLQHTPGGTAATVSVSRGHDHAVIEVSDSGPGLTAEQRDQVFERFYRADRARAKGGSGLGLSIVAAIARAHHGEADVDSTPGEGATFRVRLPLTS